jgi:hypothetical protein
VLITGSRKWPHKQFIWEQFRELRRRFPDIDPHDIVVVSGACPTGADRMCEEAAEAHGMQVERHPADWQRYGKRAGFIRNEEMVNLGAQVCMAFIYNGSPGASHTAGLAEKAGIWTIRFERGAGDGSGASGLLPGPVRRVGL